ncbi:hypothetical protein BC829DRAFT_439665 [Chytridium lagenaria]|nr:hypothetical protein BC829DRAFT_439665 [Chytridium lagenaria]
MSASELSQYQFQLEQVEEALDKDPSNKELQKLQSDLKDLIGLLAAAASREEVSRNHRETSAGAGSDAEGLRDLEQELEELEDGSNYIAKWIKGQLVLAKYKDDKFYEATVEPSPFLKRPTPKTYAVAFGNGLDRRSKKKQRLLEHQETVKAIETEHQKKQNAWKSFATGGKKTALKTAPPLKKQSMFATPDDPNARVGVIGSGKPMTHFEQRGKHIYDKDD